MVDLVHVMLDHIQIYIGTISQTSKHRGRGRTHGLPVEPIVYMQYTATHAVMTWMVCSTLDLASDGWDAHQSIKELLDLCEWVPSKVCEQPVTRDKDTSDNKQIVCMHNVQSGFYIPATAGAGEGSGFRTPKTVETIRKRGNPVDTWVRKPSLGACTPLLDHCEMR